jgi:hypothetical protein
MSDEKKCIDCGTRTVGLRCRKHHGAHLKLQAAHDKATEDKALLDEVAAGLTPARLAVRTGSSRQYAALTINRARDRQKLLQEATKA